MGCRIREKIEPEIKLNMKNICYFISSLARTGPTNQLSYIIKNLDRDKYKPIIVTLFEENEKTLISHFKQNLSVEIICIKTSKKRALFEAKKSLKEILIRENIDVIQTQGVLADFISFNQLDKNYKKISTIRNFPLDDYKNIFGKVLGDFIANAHIRLIRNNNSSFVACSKTIHETFKSKKNIQIDYIQNGVDLTKFFPLGDKVENKKQLNLPTNKTVFISVGGLIPRKDFKTLIKGFKKYNKNKDSVLVIAGEGPERATLMSMADESIIFLGNVGNVLEYLRASDCFISSSLSEGLPNAVMEAMAVGVPCLLSDIASHLELSHGKLKNMFFRTGEYEDLALKIKDINDDLSTYSDYAVKIINENFSAKRMSLEYQKRYS